MELLNPFCVSVTLVGLTVAVRPDGDTVAASAIVPANPPRLVRSIVEVPDCPARIVRAEEPVEMEKSTILTFTWTVCERDPLVRTTVTV